MNIRPKPQSAFPAILAVLSCCIALLGSEQLALSDDVANVEPYIVEATCVVVKVDTSRLTLLESVGQLADLIPGSSALPDPAGVANKWIDTLRKAVDGQPIYATIGIPYSLRDLPAYLFLKQTPQIDSQALADCLGGKIKLSDHNGMLASVMGPTGEVAAHLARFSPSPREGLKPAFAAVADYPVQVLLLPPDFIRRTVVEMQPNLPPFLGGGPSSVLTEGLVWAALGVDPGKARAEVIIQSASGRAAQDLSDLLPKIIENVYQTLPKVQQRIPRESLMALAPLVTTAVDGDRLVIRFADRKSADGSMQFLAGMIATLQARTRVETNSNSLKQIMIALHNYHDTYAMFPPRNELRDKEGKSGLSWRVHILPFVAQQKLYEQFHLDEPWDSPHNKPLIDKMPKVFQDGQPETAPGHTTFLAPVGDDTVFGGKKACKMYQISDGTSNTIALVQVKPELAVPWTSPQDYSFDPGDPVAGLHIDSDGRFLAGVVDGSIQRFLGNAKPETLLHLFQKSDGEPIERSEVR